MTKPTPSSISVSQQAANSSLGRAQKAFNALIKQIETRRERVQAWTQVVPEYRERYEAEWLPLLEEEAALQLRLVQQLDVTATQKGLTKNELRTLSDLISTIAGALLSRQPHNDVLKALFNRHSGTDYDRNFDAEREKIKAAFSDMFGFNPDEAEDFETTDDVLAHAQALFELDVAEEEAAERAHKGKTAGHKASAQHRAAQARREADKAAVGQSLREVYRKLVSALHPDRETDATEQQHKSQLMQRVNQAYEKNDLLQLLELQLTLEHINQHDIENLSEIRLKHYNKLLKEQVAELDQELMAVETDFLINYSLSPFDQIDPEHVLDELSRQIIEQKIHHLSIQRDLLDLADPKRIKAWLRQAKYDRDAARREAMMESYQGY